MGAHQGAQVSSDPTGLEHQTPVAIASISATERAAFRRCRRAWLLGTVHRLGRPEGAIEQWFGTLIHTGLEGYYRAVMEGRDDVAWEAGLEAYHQAAEKALARVAGEFGFLWSIYEGPYLDQVAMGHGMLEGYFAREAKQPIFDEIVETERRVEVPIRDPHGRRVGRLSVQTDLVGRRAGRLGVADHKTAEREASPSQLDMDDQLTAEVYAVWRARGEFPESATYNVLRKRVPAPPKVLKNKRLSQDKDQLTTFELYRQAIDDAGQEPNDYAEMLQHLLTREDPFFQREVTFRTPGQMATFERNLYREWVDMRDVARHPEKAYPNPSVFNCPRCPLKPVCQAMMDDGDAGAVIQQTLVVLDPRR